MTRMTRGPEADDTIVAVATPQGRGALGTVRLSGRSACALARRLFRPWHQVEPFPPPRCAVSGDALAVRDEDPGCPVALEAIDRGVLLHFPAADSPTGEDLVEITLHGSPLVLERLVVAAVACGARPALPGEFTYRAFLHGRLDAVQAEAIDDLIHARTGLQARVAYRQQCGALSRAVEAPRTLLVECVARLEGSIEFSATETEDFLEPVALEANLGRVHAALRDVLAGAAHGLRLQSGVRVVLAGPVNAGKSSIFNKLGGIDRAIVSAVPGTTRDVIDRQVEWDGLLVTLVDTAGERDDPTDQSGEHAGIEQEGQRRGLAARRDADLVLWVTEFGAPAARLQPEPGAPPQLHVVNKIDLAAASTARVDGGDVQVSALTGAGLTGLQAAAIALLAPGADGAEPPLVTRLRQKLCLERAVAEIEAATTLVHDRAGEEILVVPLHRGLEELAELTGRGGLDEIYDRIFSTFCIGK